MADQITVITDTSLLVNFLAIDQVDLLVALPGKQFVVTDHVRSEVTEHYDEQLKRLTLAINAGQLAEIAVTDLGRNSTPRASGWTLGGLPMTRAGSTSTKP